MISALLPNYARADLAFERGEGAWLWTVDGRRFLDFGSGIATAASATRIRIWSRRSPSRPPR